MKNAGRDPTIGGLSLQLERNETIIIGDSISIKLVQIRGRHAARIYIRAPKNVSVHRLEVYEKIQREAQAAAPVTVPDAPRASALAPDGG